MLFIDLKITTQNFKNSHDKEQNFQPTQSSVGRAVSNSVISATLRMKICWTFSSDNIVFRLRNLNSVRLNFQSAWLSALLLINTNQSYLYWPDQHHMWCVVYRHENYYSLWLCCVHTALFKKRVEMIQSFGEIYPFLES